MDVGELFKPNGQKKLALLFAETIHQHWNPLASVWVSKTIILRQLLLPINNVYAGSEFGYRLSKPVYHCDVREGILNCTDDSDEHVMDLGVVCGLHNTDQRKPTILC